MTNELAQEFVSDASVRVQECWTQRNNLSLQMSRSDRPVLLKTSATEGEGKSYVAANLAAVFAMEGKKTLLVEGNLHRPIQSLVFDVKDTEGLLLLSYENDAEAVNVDDLVINTKS